MSDGVMVPESFKAGDDDGGCGDTFTADWFRDLLLLEIDEPWAGCTETGFGQTGRITLGRADAERFRDWLIAAAPPPAEARPDHGGAWQTMDSAPKDGTWIIAKTAREVVPVRWGLSWNDQHWANGCVIYQPEAWQPLPASGEAQPVTALTPLQTEKLVSLIGEALNKAWEHGEACGMGDNPDPFNATERAQAILSAMVKP